MNLALLEMALQFILEMIPQVTNDKNINQVVGLLEGWLPTIEREAEGLLPIWQQILTLVRAKPTLTGDQVAQVDGLIAQGDAAFDAAAKAAGI